MDITGVYLCRSHDRRARTDGPSFCGGYFDGDESASLAVWDAAHSARNMVDLIYSANTWIDFPPFTSPSPMAIIYLPPGARTVSTGYSSATYKTPSLATMRAKVSFEPIDPWQN